MKSPAISWEGSFYAWHSLAHVNRELVSRLARRGVVQNIVPHDRWTEEIEPPHYHFLKELEGRFEKVDLTIRHSFPPNLASGQSELVLMQPWEFLRAPTLWVDAVRGKLVRELWVNSEFTRSSYVQSGAPPEKVRVMPLGFDDSVFHASEHAPEGQFRFLYVGGTIERKGIDILMHAYLAEFRRFENVKLVIKDTGSRHVYAHANHVASIQDVANDPGAAQVELITEDLTPAQLADLMRSCHCLVQPYRAEGFCIPVLEAMACGVVPIVTHGGPTDDFVDNSCGYKIASRQVPLPQTPGLESLESQGWIEPSIDDLRHQMRRAINQRTEWGSKRRQAVARAAQFTWDAVAGEYEARILELASMKEECLPSDGTITLCMIVRNEERVLEECLRSSVPYFDQVIVVDTGSTDRTKEICRAFGVDLRESTWPDSFAEARNESLQGATGDWIMWIDADDTISKECIDCIRAAVRTAPEDVIGMVIPVRFVEETGFGTEVDHVKVFRNWPDLRWEGRIHEQILPSLRDAARSRGISDGGRIIRLPTFVLHSGYDTSIEGQARKRERDAYLLELDLRDRPGHPFVLFNLGMTAHYTDDHAGAVDWLDKSIKNSHPSESHVRKAYALMAASYRRLGDAAEAMRRLNEGLLVIPGDPEMNFHLAQIWAEAGAHDRAIEHYTNVLEAEVGNAFTSLDPGILGYKTRHNLALSYLALGRYDAARNQWVAALEESGKPEVAYTLFESAIENGDFATMRFALQWVSERLGQGESWANMVVRSCEEAGLDPVPQLNEALQVSSLPMGIKRVLAKHLLNTARQADAIPLLQELQSCGDPEGAFFLGVLAEENNEPGKALRWFEVALSLNPAHAETRARIEHLRNQTGF